MVYPDKEFKTFDFNKCMYSDAHKMWLLENHRKPISELVFMHNWFRIKKEGWSPSYTKKLYHNLKTKYGFFRLNL